MPVSNRVICLEFNELVPDLIDRFIEQGKLPNFRRLRDQSQTFITDAEASGEWLNPWVQWVTIHSGLDAADHEIYRLSNAYQLSAPAIWDVISQEGKKVWVCGSMNPWISQEGEEDSLNGFVLPDPWSHQISPFPSGEFETYYEFVRANVREYASSSRPTTWRDGLDFLKYLSGRGLKLATVFSIIKQFILERTGRHRWKRAAILDAFQCDLFEFYYRKHSPDFSTFFSNCTAHYQHKYWRNMEPEKFRIRSTATEQRAYKNAILYGYRQMDRIIGRIMALDPEAHIVLMSGLSQQPFHERDGEGGVRHYRLIEKNVLTDVLKIRGDFSYEPIMADEFFLRFVNGIDAAACVDRLLAFRLPNGEPAFHAELDGDDVIGQCRCRALMPEDAVLTVQESGEKVPFGDVFYWVDSVKSGTHHPDGVLWISNAPHASAVADDANVKLTAIAPTILDLMGLPKSDAMHDRSLFENSRVDATTANENAELVLA